MSTDPGPLNTFQVFLLNFIQFKKFHYTQGDHFEWATLGARKLYNYSKISRGIIFTLTYECEIEFTKTVWHFPIWRPT